MQRDNRFFMDPSDIRSDLTWKWKDEMKENDNIYQIIDDQIIFKRNIKVDQLSLNKLKPINGVIEVDGTLRVKRLEGKTYENINFSELLETQIFNGNLRINGDFDIVGDVNWSGKTNFIDTQVIRAEDNVINLNYKGNNQSAVNGGIILKHGITDGEDCSITIDGDGYWNVNPGMNLIALNVEHLNIESEDDNLVMYLNGKKIKINYEEIK